jgi:hypothetical protein
VAGRLARASIARSYIPLAGQRIEHVQGALVGETGDSMNPSYRVELATEDGHDTPLSDITASKWHRAVFVGSFNDFVRRGQSAADFLQLPDLISARCSCC